MTATNTCVFRNRLDTVDLGSTFPTPTSVSQVTVGLPGETKDLILCRNSKTFILHFVFLPSLVTDRLQHSSLKVLDMVVIVVIGVGISIPSPVSSLLTFRYLFSSTVCPDRMCLDGTGLSE